MSGDLIKFTAEPYCLKCGSDDLQKAYRPPPNKYWMKTTAHPIGVRVEHIEIKCHDCNYMFGMWPKHPCSITEELPEAQKPL